MEAAEGEALSARRWKGESMLNSSWRASVLDGRVNGVQCVRDHWAISMANFCGGAC